MTISVIKEPPELMDIFGVMENCYFCNLPTLYWHERTNNPVCPSCSKTRKVAELKKPSEETLLEEQRNE